MKRASIDIGSNSTLFLLAEVEPEFKEIQSLSRITRLGRGIDVTKLFHPEAMDETFEALKEYRDIAQKHNVKAEDIIVTATEASRVVSNSKEFFSRVKSELGLTVQVISSEGEAYYTAMGVSFASNQEDEAIIVDMGGASTEFIKVQLNPFKLADSISLPIGAVRATDWIKSSEFDSKFDSILNHFDTLNDYKIDKIIGVAGTLTSMAALILGLKEYIFDKVHGSSFSIEQIKNLYQKIEGLSPENLLELYPLLGKRADNIAGGIYALIKLMDLNGIKEVEISCYGLRYGTVISGQIEERFRG